MMAFDAFVAAAFEDCVHFYIVDANEICFPLFCPCTIHHVSPVLTPMTAKGAGGDATQRRLRWHIAVGVATAVSAVDRPTARGCLTHAHIGSSLNESVVSIGLREF
jgi:hypothetical protein